MEGWGLRCSCGSYVLPQPTCLVSLLWPQLVKVLRFSGVPVPAGYEIAFQRAMWAFRHCRWEACTVGSTFAVHVVHVVFVVLPRIRLR